MKVLKRNKQLERFNINKILKAVEAAYKSTNKEVDLDVMHELEYSPIFLRGDVISVETIQDEVEKILMDLAPYEVARAYIVYREEHKAIRKYAQEKIDFINRYKNSDNTANATVDDNSNVSGKNIGILNSEIHKKDNIQISRRMVVEKLRELYPNFNAKQYIKDLDNHVIYKHDESSFSGAIAPYCCSISMYPFLTDGIKNIGGLSAAPKNIDSFCGMYVNLIFATSAMFAGACLYKDQELFVQEGGIAYKRRVKDLITTHLNKPLSFSNYQGEWEYATCDGLKVLEDGKLVDVTKVYRRKYKDKIYKITTRDGHIAQVSKDHIFKQLIQGRLLDIKAEQLKELDTVVMNKDYSSIINFKDKEFKKGWIIGMLCGDGCLTKESTVGLSVNYEQEYLGEIFNSYLKEIYGYELHKNKGHRCWNYTKRNQTLLDLIHEDIIGSTTYDKHINLQNKSLDYIAGFLDGLFCADGSYTESQGIAISLTNKELATNIHNAINYFDLNSHICTIAPKGNRKESYSQYISSKILKYLFHIHKKILKRGTLNKKDVSREVYFYGYNAFQGRHTSNKRMEWSNSNQETILNTDVIDSIEILDNDDDYVYEIETTSHWYNCGGFITHNCATSEFLLYFTYFCKKEWGNEFYLKPDIVISTPLSYRKKTIRSQIHQYWQQVVYSINQPAAARGLQSAFVNFTYFDKAFFEGMFGNFYFPDGTKPDWPSLNWIQREFMQWFNQERLRTMLTFPVESFALVYKHGEFVDLDSAKFVAKEYARGHSFFTYISDTVDSLSSCCRLKNMITTKEFNFTNGNMGIQTGSKSVITLNINRIIQDYFGPCKHEEIIKKKYWNDTVTQEQFVVYFKSILSRIYKYHNAYNELLWDMYNNNLLPVYKAGFIDLNKQYLTIGLNGLNQAAEFIGLKCNDNEEYSKFCQLIFSTIKEENLKHKTKTTIYNTEQVPAESLAVKNYNCDKEDGYWVPEDTNLYASYIFKPNDPNVTVLDKLKLHGSNYIGDYLDGGWLSWASYL